MSIGWWSKEYGVERACTCPHQSAECSRGWHVVDSWESLELAQADAREWTSRVGVPYRVILTKTGEPLP